MESKRALTIHGQTSELPLAGWQTSTPLLTSHKVTQTRVPKRQWLQSAWWKWCRLEWRSWWQKINHWLFLQTGIQWGSSQLANQETADSGSLPAKLNIRFEQQQSKNPPSWDHWCVKWATSRCKQQWLVKTTKAASDWLPSLLCINDPSISIQNITSYEKKLTTTQFNWSTRQLINWQQICWQNHFHKWKWSNIESNYWVNCRFLLTTTEQSEWGCSRIELWQNSWATKLKLLYYSSSKSRNKLTWFGCKLQVVRAMNYMMVTADSNYLLMFNLSCSSIVNTKYLTPNYDLKIGIWGDSEVHDYCIEVLHFFMMVRLWRDIKLLLK